MKTLRTLVFGILGAFLVAAPGSPVSAQETSTDPAGNIEASLAERASDTHSDRSALVRFLQQENVKEAAARSGIDLENLENRLKAVSDQEASDLWKKVQAADDDLAGGDTITIASSTVIIILLVIILVQVA